MRVHLLLDQDPLDELRRDRGEVELVGHPLAGLDGGDVGIDEHRGDALLLERLDRLRAGVVELAGLADLQRARAEDEDLARLAGEVGAVHGHLLAIAPTRRRKSSKRKAVSSGPGEASGWNCTLKNGRVRARMPSLVPSLTLTNHGSQSAGSDSSPHRVAVVLAGDVAAAREQVLHRLVHAAVAVGQLVGVAPGGEREDLVAQADAEDGLAVGGQQRAHLLDQRHQVLRVTGAVADDDAVALGGERREVGVPGRAHHRCPALEERADHVVLGARVHQQHLERAALVADDIVRGHEAEDLLLHVHRLRRVAGRAPGRPRPAAAIPSSSRARAAAGSACGCRCR